MFQVQCLQSTKNKTTELYSKYSIGPFIKGQSTTVGNALRRILLSNLQGLAITGVRITGVSHEFTSIPGIVEDVTEIILNLKGVRFSFESDKPIVAKISVVVSKIVELPSHSRPLGGVRGCSCMIVPPNFSHF